VCIDFEARQDFSASANVKRARNGFSILPFDFQFLKCGNKGEKKKLKNNG